ncbi:MAG TPA: hypothetical protein VHM91_24220, partial [Verrucomicrobiales bacterium]|nr:hypothetical protein [Verrucomicrobiales bacterium]
GNGTHLVEARYADPSGKVLQDPQDVAIDARLWTVNVSVPSSDSDGDGLPDAWETANFGNLLNSATGDPDGDGATNAAEYIAGTHPAQGASRLEILSAVLQAGNTVKLRWSSVPGKYYWVQTATNPATGPWIDAIQTPAAAAPATFTEGQVNVPPGAAAFFIRVRAGSPP